MTFVYIILVANTLHLAFITSVLGLLCLFQYVIASRITETSSLITTFKEKELTNLKTEVAKLTTERDLVKANLSQLENTILKRILE